MTEHRLLGRHVYWEHVGGKGVSGADGGFGSVSVLEVGGRLFIYGDYGITTSKVQDIEDKEDGSTLVKTQNSVYKLTPRNVGTNKDLILGQN